MCHNKPNKDCSSFQRCLSFCSQGRVFSLVVQSGRQMAVWTGIHSKMNLVSISIIHSFPLSGPGTVLSIRIKDTVPAHRACSSLLGEISAQLPNHGGRTGTGTFGNHRNIGEGSGRAHWNASLIKKILDSQPETQARTPLLLLLTSSLRLNRVPSEKICWSPNTLIPQNVALCEDKVSKNELTRVDPNPMRFVSLEKEEFGHEDRYMQRDDSMKRRRKKAAVCKARGEAVTDPHLTALWRNQPC